MIVKPLNISQVKIVHKFLNLDKSNQYFGLYDQDKLLAVAAYKKVRNEYHLKSNYTFPEYRKKGLMTYLLKEMINQLGNTRLVAYCFDTSWRIYLRLGFELKKVVPHKFFDTYIMIKEKTK